MGELLGQSKQSQLLIRWPLVAGFAAALVVRLIYNAFRGLAPDEAYYWVWSRHLQPGYFDHPPMVAVLIRAATMVFGSTEFAVHLPAALLSIATAAMAVRLVARVTTSPQVCTLAALVLLCTPILTVSATVITPDTPLMFFVTAGLLIASELFKYDMDDCHAPRLWYAIGVCGGLAMLSKYTGVLLPAAVLLTIIVTPELRYWLRRPGPYEAAAIALAIASPVIWWNAQHDWVSIRFQLTHGLAEGKSPGIGGFVAYLGSLAITYSPLILIGIMIAAISLLRRFRDQQPAVRLCVIATLLPLLLFAESSFSKKVEANWPAVAFPPAVVVLMAWADQAGTRARALVSVGWKVGLVMAVLAHVPEVSLLTHIRIAPAYEAVGWKQFANSVEAVRDGRTVVASNYQNAAELSFYLPGQPSVWSINVNRRPNAYDYLPGKPNMGSIDRALFVGGDPGYIASNFAQTSTREIRCRYLGVTLRKRELTFAQKEASAAALMAADGQSQ